MTASKFSPRELFKRTFSGSKSPTSESEDRMNAPSSSSPLPSPALTSSSIAASSPSTASTSPSASAAAPFAAFAPASASASTSTTVSASASTSSSSSSSSSLASTSPSNAATSPLSDNVRRMPSLRQVPESGPVHTSSNPLGMLKSQRQPFGVSHLTASASASSTPTPSGRGTRMRDLMNRRAAAASPGAQAAASSSVTPNGTETPAQREMNPKVPMATPPMKLQMPGGAPPPMKLQMPGGVPAMKLQMPGRPAAPGQSHSAPGATKPGAKAKDLATRRGAMMKMTLDASDMNNGRSLSMAARGSRPAASTATAALMDKANAKKARFGGSQLDEFREFINPEEGWLNFDGSATLTKDGVHFANGNTYRMSLNEIESLGELGKGNYGTVYKVRHAKNRQVRMGPGLSGAKPLLKHSATDPTPVSQAGGAAGKNDDDELSGTIMAMKEIGMELDKAKFKTIAKELMILHQCSSPYIIDFYGAFMQDGFVYMCIEYMDGGSVDKLYSDGVPEDVLQHITLATVLGLNELKEKHNIIHRDVKPTNILVNTRGQVKICDFGVSGDLVASKAKTNIGCQSYMPPERINSGTVSLAGADVDGGGYGVQSDIWSLGLSIIECALGKYPYDVDAGILVQLNTIVKGEAPKLPESGYSPAAHDFVARCLAKNPIQRPSYTVLLRHPWLASVMKPATISEEDEDVEAVTAGVGGVGLGTSKSHVQQPGDKLVADWVKTQLRKNGVSV
ncbi:hypothetical protein TD95_004240 [Thielaviopsis punctulata]|uniref:mitogen-activated protein kinase kinase n=1 Tax=Thielaviopsis punctulata TaxID=72032 RepID=A0A0F4Z835_9PEZI|nr:hypothetical protein TD95_004240 [Thielaviopsis punctulata]